MKTRKINVKAALPFLSGAHGDSSPAAPSTAQGTPRKRLCLLMQKVGSLEAKGCAFCMKAPNPYIELRERKVRTRSDFVLKLMQDLLRYPILERRRSRCAKSVESDGWPYHQRQRRSSRR